MARDVEEYTPNELAVGVIKQLRRIGDGIEERNRLQQALLDSRADKASGGSDEGKSPEVGNELSVGKKVAKGKK